MTQSILTILIIVTFVTIGTLLIGSNYYMHRSEAIWSDYDSMEKLVQAIEDGRVNDDNINWTKFRNSDIYQDVGINAQKCLNLAHKVGNNIADNEIVHCSKNDQYFKQKYSKTNKANNTNISGWNSIINIATIADANTSSISGTNKTSADGNVTGFSSGTNLTSSYNATNADVPVSGIDTNETSGDANAAVSSFHTNATSGDANAAVSSFHTNATSGNFSVTSADISSR
jgi:hypothetical protein